MYFVEVILPLPLPKLYTYRINEDEAHFLQMGMRVAVSFGKSKVYTALVHKVHTNEPTYETKDIEYILDETPIVTPEQITHWQWIADYYMCTLGEVIKSALPSAFLLESETIIEIAEKDLNFNLFSDDEFQVYETLHYKTALKGSEVSKIIPKKKTLKVIKSLVEKGAARISERIFEKYVPKLVKFIRLAEDYQSQEGLQKALELLKTEKQKKLIMAYFNHINREISPLQVEKLLEENYDFSIPFALLSKETYLEEIANLPEWWNEDFARKDILFYSRGTNPNEVVEFAKKSELYNEKVYIGKNAVFWAKMDEGEFLKTTYHKKLLKQPFYKTITIRNGKTFDKIAELLQKEQ